MYNIFFRKIKFESTYKRRKIHQIIFFRFKTLFNFYHFQAFLDSNFYQSVDSLRRDGLHADGSQSDGKENY